ncbi:MAG: NAD-dependent epimerase/dehydratase family protein, partial [Bacteroidota bacterium]
IQSTKYPNYRFMRINLEDAFKVSRLFEREQFDAVIHLAAQAGVRYSIENPHTYIESNITGFINIVEACRNYPVKHLVYASSSSVYGANKKIPFSTTDNVDQPVSLYAATKKSNELMAHTYSHLFNIPTTGLRFFTVYGPWGRPDMAYFLFTKAILQNKPIKVFNHGKMARDFTYIDDIVQGIIKVLDQPPSPEQKTPYRLYNIGNNAPVPLLEFIEAIEEALGKEAKKEFLPMQPGDVEQTYADVQDLIEEFGYQPNTNVKEGIGKFVEWYLGFYGS